MTCLVIIGNLRKGLGAHICGKFRQRSAYQYNPCQLSLSVMDRARNIKHLTEIRLNQSSKLVPSRVALLCKNLLYNVRSCEGRLSAAGKIVVLGIPIGTMMDRKDVVAVQIEKLHGFLSIVSDDPKRKGAQSV